MAGEQLQSCSAGTLGIPADRGWAIRDEASGEITNGKNIPLLMQCEARYRELATDHEPFITTPNEFVICCSTLPPRSAPGLPRGGNRGIAVGRLLDGREQFRGVVG